MLNVRPRMQENDKNTTAPCCYEDNERLTFWLDDDLPKEYTMEINRKSLESIRADKTQALDMLNAIGIDPKEACWMVDHMLNNSKNNTAQHSVVSQCTQSFSNIHENVTVVHDIEVHTCQLIICHHLSPKTVKRKKQSVWWRNLLCIR